VKTKLLILLVLIIAIVLCANSILNWGKGRAKNKFEAIDGQSVIETKG